MRKSGANKISRRITQDGYLDLGWSSKEILKTRESRLERARIARQSTTQAAIDAAQAAEELSKAVQEDCSFSGDASTRAKKRPDPRDDDEEENAARPQAYVSYEGEAEPVKMAFKPARVCLLIQGIPTPDKWLAGLGIPLFQPQVDAAAMRAAEEPIYKDAYIARKSSSSAAEGSKRGEKDAPLPGWVEVVRPLEPQTTLNLSRANGGTGLVTDEQLLNRVALGVGTLTVLDITGCKLITPQTVFAIAQGNPHLSIIRASEGIGWTSSLVHQVVRLLPELESLTTDLSCIKIDDYLKALLDHPLVKIRSLCITRPIELEDLQAFAPTLLKAKIEVFDIKNCKIGPKGLFAIATALEQNPSITSLNLKKNDLGPMAGAKVGQILRGNTALRTLNVSVNSIRSEGCVEICRALCTERGNNDRITTLNLSVNAIDGEAVDAIVDMLGDNKTLDILDLADNDLGPRGKKICAALRKSTVTQIFLAGNRMGDAAGRELLKSLKSNADIWKVTIYNNELSNELNKLLSIETLESLLDQDGKAARKSMASTGGKGKYFGGRDDDEDEDDEEEDEEEDDEEEDEEDDKNRRKK